MMVKKVPDRVRAPIPIGDMNFTSFSISCGNAEDWLSHENRKQ